MKDELTEVDIKKMKEEIEYRKNVLLPKLRDDLVAAREMGDLSENFEYHAARREHNKNLSRISYLQRMIDSAIVIKPDSAADKVCLFDSVKLLCEDEDEEINIVIVTTLRQDAINGFVSKESPLGKAVMGHSVGDRVFVSIKGSDGYYVKILEIKKGTDDESLKISEY